ncbi:MAG: hypothetical protein SF182_20680 [Deltaproteobacteria bacterium]|nr:hypothetical protein [Deltaproteobacteria bacterium]
MAPLPRLLHGAGHRVRPVAPPPPLARRLPAVLLTALALSMAPVVAHAGADRFAAAGTDTPHVRQAFETLQRAVRAGDAGPVADMVAYPLVLNHAGGRHETIDDRAQFVSRFDGIFSGALRDTILAQRFDDLFGGAHGIMIGRGDLWLAALCPRPGCSDPRIAIIAINLP